MAKYVLLTKWSNRGGTPSVWFDVFPSAEDAAARVEEYGERSVGSSYAMTDSVIVTGFTAKEMECYEFHEHINKEAGE